MIRLCRLVITLLVVIYSCASTLGASQSAHAVPASRVRQQGGDDTIGRRGGLSRVNADPCREDAGHGHTGSRSNRRRRRGCNQARPIEKRDPVKERSKPSAGDLSSISTKATGGVCMEMETIRSAYMMQENNSGPESTLATKTAATSRSRLKHAINVLILDHHYGMRREMETVISNFGAAHPQFQINVYSPPEPSIIICETRGLDIWAFCGESEVEKFLELAQEKSWLRNADVVMFSMPPAALQYFLRLNKPIVMLVAVPPEYNRQNLQAYERWHADLRRAATLPHVAIVSCSVYDAMYMRYFYGIETMVIPVLGEYGGGGDSGVFRKGIGGSGGGGNVTHRNDPPGERLRAGDDEGEDEDDEDGLWTAEQNIIGGDPRRKESGTSSPPPPPLSPMSVGLFPKSSWHLAWAPAKVLAGLRNYPGNVSVVETTGELADLIDLTKYDAFVYLPYMRNTNLFIEAYRLEVPIFTPSIKYLVQLDQAHCLMSNRVYWTNIPEPCEPAYPYSPAKLEYLRYPVLTEPRSHAFWLAYSQQFRPDHPGIVFFDSPEDLAMKLLTAELEPIRATMRQANARALRRVTLLWKKVLIRLLDDVASLHSGSTGLHPFTGPTNMECDERTFQKYFSRTRSLDNNLCPNPMALDIEGMPGRHSCGFWDKIPY